MSAGFMSIEIMMLAPYVTLMMLVSAKSRQFLCVSCATAFAMTIVLVSFISAHSFEFFGVSQYMRALLFPCVMFPFCAAWAYCCSRFFKAHDTAIFVLIYSALHLYSLFITIFGITPISNNEYTTLVIASNVAILMSLVFNGNGLYHFISWLCRNLAKFIGFGGKGAAT